MSGQAYLKNKDFLREDRDGALSFNINHQPRSVFDIHDEGDVLVIESKADDPAMLLEPDPAFPDTWKKSRFAELGKAPEASLVAEAEARFGMDYQDIVQTKRTIGAMTTIAFVFDRSQVERDEDMVKIAVVQRTSVGPDGTPNMGALSRFGGGVSGGKSGTGVHGAQHLGNQTVRELLEEFHPYVRSEAGVLTPVDIIPQGYEVNGLKGEFMSAVMAGRQELATRIDANLVAQGHQIGVRESLMAVPLAVEGLTKPVIQMIDGNTVHHPHVVTFDAQPGSKNMDFNTDHLFAVRVHGVSPKDFILKDGETDQRTNRLLDRIIFFGHPDELRSSAAGEIVQLHPQSDMTKPSVYSPAFKPILAQGERIVTAALDRCL